MIAAFAQASCSSKSIFSKLAPSRLCIQRSGFGFSWRVNAHVTTANSSFTDQALAENNTQQSVPSWTHGIERIGREELFPSPVSILEQQERLKELVPEDHPLYAFFYSREQSLPDPIRYNQHGRAWAVDELRGKSFEDLHTLWWLCIREINIHKTFYRELKRVHAKNFGFVSRLRIAKRNMSRIKFVLSERYNSWNKAMQLLEKEGITIDQETGLFLENESMNTQLEDESASDKEMDSIQGSSRDRSSEQ